MEAVGRKSAQRGIAAVLGLLCLGGLVLSVTPAARAADSRCPIIILPAANGGAPDLRARQELPDGERPKAGAKTGLYGRDSLADDFEQSKPAPFWDVSRLDPHSFALTSAGVSNGLRAMLLTLHRGDNESFLEDKATGDRRCTERTEISEASDYWPRVGDDLWYGFALYLPPDLPAIDRRLVLAAIKQVPAKYDAAIFSLAETTPVLALRLREIAAAKTLCLYLTPGNDDMTDRKPLAIVQLARSQALGGWHNIVLHARLAHGKNGASTTEWWFDDQLVPRLGNKPVLIGYKDGGAFSYFQLGLYRDQAIRGSGEIDQDWTIGYDAVKREIGYEGRPGDVLTERSVAPVPLESAATLSDTAICRKALAIKP